MYTKRRSVYVSLFSVVLAVLLTSCADDAPADDAPEEMSPRFETTACQHELVDDSTTQCGFLVVPENREDAHNSNTIKVYITIFKSAGNNPGNAPALYLTGGPGAETTFAKALFEDPSINPDFNYRAGFGGNRDLIVVDQRGTNNALPSLYCSQELGPVAPEVYGMDFHEAANQRVALLQKCHKRLTAEGNDLSAYDTTQNATDIRDLVSALGLQRVNLYCASYGTRLCLFIMRLFPEILQSVVLDSVLPPEINPFEREVEGTLFALNAFYKATAEQYPDLRQQVESIADRLQAEPVQVITRASALNAFDAAMTRQFPDLIKRLQDGPASTAISRALNAALQVTVSVSGDKFASYVVGRLRLTPYDDALPKKIARMFADENYQEVASDWIGNVNFFWPSGGPGSTAPSLGMYNSVFAAEDAFYTTPGRISLSVERRIQNDALAEWYLTNFIYMEPSVARRWPVAPQPVQVFDPVVSRVPTLMLVGALDPATPQIFSRPAAALLSNAFYRVIRSGHATAFLPCVVDMIHTFYIDPTTAPTDDCPSAFTWQ